jgi:23S rRNA (cytidine1920-2'-O)/16S rRNA (cytidine1409-2'-O)-methyltransferase
VPQRNRHVRLVEALARNRPDLDDPEGVIVAGRVLVDGAVVSNPRSRVDTSSSLVVSPPHRLRGETKLAFALEAFGVAVAGRVAVDAGASAGGFTRALLGAGATRVYAVDAGHGQLLGSLRQDPRVVNLEDTNLADLGPEMVPEPVGLVTLDLSYLPIAQAVPQLEVLRLQGGSDLVALVKPMFELGLATAPRDPASLESAAVIARSGIESAGWRVLGACRSPVPGSRGAIEGFVHARRSRGARLSRAQPPVRTPEAGGRPGGSPVRT